MDVTLEKTTCVWCNKAKKPKSVDYYEKSATILRLLNIVLKINKIGKK